MAQRVKREEPAKDSKSSRVNYDNMSEKKFDRKFEPRSKTKSSGSKRRRTPKDRSAKSPSSQSMGAFAPYSRNPELVLATGRIPNNYFPGSPIEGLYSGMSTAAVMRLLYTPVIYGRNQVTTRQSINDQYSFVVHANSRNYTYSAETMHMVEVAGAEVFAALLLGIRAYGLMQQYSAVNTYLPDLLIEACGFNPTNLRSNYATMNADLNLLISATKTIWIPKTMNYLTRWTQLNSYVFMDSSSVKDQFYAFVPRRYHKIVIDDLNDSYKLQPVEFVSVTDGEQYTDPTYSSTYAGMLWADYIARVREMIDALSALQDRGNIMGNILKAYGGENIVTMDALPLDYITPISNDMTMLHSIMNTILTPFSPGACHEFVSTTDPTQPPQLYQEWREWKESTPTKPLSAVWIEHPIINVKNDFELTPENLFCITRNMPCGLRPGSKFKAINTSGANGGQALKSLVADGKQPIRELVTPFTYGDTVVNAVRIYCSSKYRSPGTSAGFFSAYTILPMAYYCNFPTLNAGERILLESMLMQFDWRPIQYRYISAIGSDSLQYPNLWNEVTYSSGQENIVPASGMILSKPWAASFEAENVMEIDAASLDAMNEVCWKSIMGVPVSLNLSNKAPNYSR